MQAISIRPLGPEDASHFRSLRLAALRDAPQAFGSSYEEEHLVTPQEWARRLEPAPTRAVFGAWDGERLVGSAGLLRMAPLKQLHKAVIWGYTLRLRNAAAAWAGASWAPCSKKRAVGRACARRC